MTRILAVLLVVFLASYFLGRVKFLGAASKNRNPTTGDSGRRAVVDVLVPCAVCGTLVPAARAVTTDQPRGSARYCSAACRSRADEASTPS